MRFRTHSWIPTTALAAIVLLGCDAGQQSDARSPAGAEPAPGPGSLAEALENPDPYARARLLGTILPRLGPEAVPEVQQVLEDFRVDLGGVEFELLLRFWATHEPAEATRWTFKKSSPLYRMAAVRTAVDLWAEADPAAAVVAVESAVYESNEEVGRIADLALVSGWFRTDREGLEQYIHGLGSGVRRQRALFMYALSLTRADGSDAAVRWGESIPDDNLRYKYGVFRQIMSALTWADMDGAVRFCAAHCDGPYGKGLRNVLARARLRNGEDGAEIVEWVARVPEGDEEQRANKRHSLWVAYSTWAYRDRESAVAWMDRKTAEVEEPEPWVRQLYGEYARQIAVDSPERAIEWAERVEDEVDRERTLVRIARFWRKQDEEAAEAWLAQSSLSERARAQARDTQTPDYLPRRQAP